MPQSVGRRGRAPSLRYDILWSVPEVNPQDSVVCAIFLGEVRLNGVSERQEPGTCTNPAFPLGTRSGVRAAAIGWFKGIDPSSSSLQDAAGFGWGGARVRL